MHKRDRSFLTETHLMHRNIIQLALMVEKKCKTRQTISLVTYFIRLKHWSRSLICISRNNKAMQKMVSFIFYTLKHIILQISQKRVRYWAAAITIKIAPFQSTLYCGQCSKLFMLHKRVLSIFKFAECPRFA